MNKAENNSPSQIYKYSVMFKLSWASHTLLQEIATKTGKNMTDAARDLLEMGMDEWSTRGELASDPKVKLVRAVRKARERENIQQHLAYLRWEKSQEEFNILCRSLGENPEDYADIPLPIERQQKQEKCRSFLRVLFTNRPEGLPVNRVLEIAKREGIGQNLVRGLTEELGIKQEWETTDGVRVSIWKPPTEW